MEEIELILQNNLNNRITNELIIGMTGVMTHCINERLSQAATDLRAQLEAEFKDRLEAQIKKKELDSSATPDAPSSDVEVASKKNK